jgi:hypothetical protein
MTIAQQRSIWDFNNQFRISREKYWKPKVYAELQRMIRVALDKPSVTIALAELDFSLPIDGMAKLIQNIYIDAGRIQGAYTYQQVRREAAKALMPIGYNEDLVNEIIAYYNQYLLAKVVLPISDTMKDWIREQVIKRELEGKSITQIVDELVKHDFPLNRAFVITRTEVMRAANHGAMQGAKKAGYDVTKVWISAVDNRTRRIPRDQFSHLQMNGIEVGYDEAFQVPRKTGGYEQMMQPGDINGSAADVIQCFLPNEKTSINPAIIKNAFRSWHKGEIITVNLSSGKEFTCTVNHPILTANGWVKAGSLQHDFKLIKSSVLNKRSSKLNVNNIPSTFEKVYNSLSICNMSVRQSRISVNFYGDIPASDVDIVIAKIKLSDRIKAINLKHFITFLFAYSYFRASGLFCYCCFRKNIIKIRFWHISHSFMRFFSNCFSFFFGSLLHPFIHRFTAISWVNLIGFKDSANNMTGAIKAGSNQFNTIARIERGNDLRFGQFPDQFICDFNSSGFQYGRNFGIIHPEILSDILNTHSRFIEFDDVVSIVRHNYEGFVYTFETDSQMYDVSGIIAKNCRCTVGFIPISKSP